MAGKSGPDIVENGLVLCLDAANKLSYRGTGTTWNDLSGNNSNGTLTNGPTFSAGNLGSISFDGTNDNVSSFPSQISGTGSKTVSAFIYLTSTGRMGICGTRDTADLTGAGWVLTVNRIAGYLTYFNAGGAVNAEVANVISTNSWIQVVVTYNSSNFSTILYVNGIQVGSPFTLSAMRASSFNGVIGDENNSSQWPFNGRISSVLIYNRTLSAAEVLQNYNATKSRFGR
jgi:hypothetical protein